MHRTPLPAVLSFFHNRVEQCQLVALDRGIIIDQRRLHIVRRLEIHADLLLDHLDLHGGQVFKIARNRGITAVRTGNHTVL